MDWHWRQLTAQLQCPACGVKCLRNALNHTHMRKRGKSRTYYTQGTRFAVFLRSISIRKNQVKFGQGVVAFSWGQLWPVRK